MLSPKQACEDYVRKKYKIRSNVDLGDVCTERGKLAAVSCSIEHSKPGLVNELGSCTVSKCPVGTKKVGGNCVKNGEDDKNPSVVNLSTEKTSRCEEKWYDWFSNQFHHLGNRHQMHDDKCYSPCKTGYVPFSKNDAVTDTNYIGKDEPDKCVPVSLHFAGKYKHAPLHCSTAWIRRLGKTKNDTIVEATKFIQRIPENNRADPHIIQRATNLAKQEAAKAHVDAVHLIPSGAELSMARNVGCSSLDAERLTEAYDICKKIDHKYIENLKQDSANLGLGEAHGKSREVMLKAMCDSKFCKSDNICFKEARTEARNMKGFDPTVQVDDLRTGFRVFRGLGIFSGDSVYKVTKGLAYFVGGATLFYVIWIFFLRDIIMKIWLSIMKVLEEKKAARAVKRETPEMASPQPPS